MPGHHRHGLRCWKRVLPGAIIDTTTQLPHARPAEGYPLGEPLLYLRAIRERGDRNMFCSVENAYDQPLLRIQPASNMPSWTGNRMYAELRFVALNPDGTVRFFITRTGTQYGQWDGQMMQVHDGAGRDLGRLRTTAPVAQFSRANGLTLGFEYNRQWLAVTETRQFQSNQPTQIFDAAGTPIAQIRRQGLQSNSRYVHYSDYLLDCSRPMPHPISELMLVALFYQYFYERLLQGPLTSMFGLYG